MQRLCVELLDILRTRIQNEGPFHLELRSLVFYNMRRLRCQSAILIPCNVTNVLVVLNGQYADELLHSVMISSHNSKRSICKCYKCTIYRYRYIPDAVMLHINKRKRSEHIRDEGEHKFELASFDTADRTHRFSH